MDVELGLITAVIDTRDLSRALKNKIQQDFFEDEGHAAVWEWMVDYYHRYSESPTEEALVEQFPKYHLSDEVEEPLDYYIDQLREKRKKSLITDALIGVREFYDEGRTDDAVKWLASSLHDIQSQTAQSRDIDFTEGADMWLDEYLARVQSGGLFKGIPTGFPFIDQVLGGFQPGQLITIIGLPKAGKSTSILWSNIAAHEAANKTFTSTMEMSDHEFRLRHHCWRARISYNHLKFGKLTADERIRLRKMLNGLTAMPPMIFCYDPSATSTVSTLAAKIAEYKPDIAYVDGVYLMESEVPGLEKGSAQALTSITRDLKRTAQRLEIPIVCTTQALPSKFVKRMGLQISTIGYTSSFAQDSDAIFGINPIPDTPGAIEISVVAARDAPPGKQRYSINWNTGEFIELDEEYYEDDEVDE